MCEGKADLHEKNVFDGKKASVFTICTGNADPAAFLHH